MATAGRLSSVEVFNGVDWINVGGLVDATLNGNIDELECTDHDSDGVREYSPNLFDATLDVTLRWNDEDPGQTVIMNSVFPVPSILAVRFRLQTGAGFSLFEADAFATTWSPSGPLDDAAGIDITFRLSEVV